MRVDTKHDATGQIPVRNPLIYRRHSPLDGQLIGEFTFATDLEIRHAVAKSRKAYESWSNKTIESRGRLLRAVAGNLETNADELARIVRLETGKPTAVALNEVFAAIEMCYLMSAHGRLPIGRQIPSAVDGRQTTVMRVPRGVAALLVSYNTPIPNYAWKVFPALVSGNTAILKPSPYTPLSSEFFGQLLNDSGIPENVLIILQGDSETGSRLVAADIDLISFTGSSYAGREIGRVTAGQLKKTILELGGSNPFIVCEDADIPKAAKVAIDSAFSNAGQRCASASRIIVQGSILEVFLREFTEKAKELSIGIDYDCDLGTLIDPTAVAKFESFLKECAAAGANVQRVGMQKGVSDSIALPAIISNLPFDHPLAQTEIFGPATRIFSFASESEASVIANSTPFGLTAAIWTRNSDRAYRLSNAVRAGLINVNGPTHGAEANMPFGGFGDSGNGTREAGIEALDYYSDLKVFSTFHTLTQ